MEETAHNMEIMKISGFLRGINADCREALVSSMTEVLNMITASEELTLILKEKSEGFNPQTFLTDSIVSVGDRKALLIPAEFTIPYCVTVMYLVANGSYSLGDILREYYYSPYGEAEMCRLFVGHQIISLARAFEECVWVPEKPVISNEISDDDRASFISCLRTIREIITGSKVIFDDKKKELHSFTAAMMDCIDGGNYKLYKVLSVGFKNSLVGVHQSDELNEAVTALEKLENGYVGILV